MVNIKYYFLKSIIDIWNLKLEVFYKTSFMILQYYTLVINV